MQLLNVFEKIVLSSIIGSVIVLIILITKIIFRNKLNSTFNYCIWLILLIKLIVPFGPRTSFNISNLYENSYLQTITNENQINSLNQLDNLNLSDSTSTNTFETLDKDVISNPVKVPLKNKIDIKKILWITWIVGVLLLIGKLVGGHKKLRGIIRASIKNVSSTHKEILYNCMETMDIRTKVEISYSKKIISPSLCGFIKPKILIPVSIAVNISDEEFKYIVMHELIHLKNKDIFINWVITLLSIIYWFNPILHYGFHRMRQDCEFSCDSQVISYLGIGGHLQYGNALIRVLELACSSNRLIGTTPMVMNSLEMKRRIIMISKYKKINIKGILLGAVVVIIIGALGVALNTSSIGSNKKNVNATTLQVESPVTTSKSTIKNTSSVSPTPTIKKLASDNANSIVPFLADIVIYNSHPNETYSSGKKVTDVGALLNDKLVKEGFNSHFIKINQPTNYNKSFQLTRTMIIKNVKEYSNTILIDIHCDSTLKVKSDGRKILFILTQENPRYEENKKFVDSLSGNFKNSNDVESDILLYQYGISFYNEDLSNKASLIEIGNTSSSDSDIETCLNALVSALKNTQKVSSN